MLGTQLLTFPAAADQPGLSARLAYHGLAYRLPLCNARAANIRELILATLANKTMRQRVKEMGRLLVERNMDDRALRNAVCRLVRRAGCDNRSRIL